MRVIGGNGVVRSKDGVKYRLGVEFFCVIRRNIFFFVLGWM